MRYHIKLFSNTLLIAEAKKLRRNYSPEFREWFLNLQSDAIHKTNEMCSVLM